MRTAIVCALATLTAGCLGPGNDFKAETIVALERGALDRWGNGDPDGYLALYASEVSYFDPTTEKRIDGVEAMRKYYAPLAGKIKVDRYEMQNVSVQRHGETAVLSYNLFNFGATFDGQTPPDRPWNSTKIYALVGGQWKIVHDHWSYIKPDLK